MAVSSDQDQKQARAGRVVSLVIAGAMVLWLAAQWLGPQLGLPGRYALLIDFAAIGALVWALVVTLQLWRKRQDKEG
ncbi:MULTISPECIES: DUF5337 domain-containing protein [Lentibacter]|jgi:hypothetical protein|uniref:DUF5337 domain-containing protein n=1 Tax=Lentibacter TaxID=1434014 RepID=UPI000B7F67DB|nr:DUF5337 domain-containing protein [Lentibacter algarum]MCO4778015.1 DUF5337 domain-containing protein [Lentibacter algarum]MCO4828725.1 DUF5337 domain-containing protein [Lentibacter algarum]